MDTGQPIRAGETGSLRLSALCSAMVVTAGCSKSRERLGHDLLTLENSHSFFFCFETAAWFSCLAFQGTLINGALVQILLVRESW